jgi:hypothetical protein
LKPKSFLDISMEGELLLDGQKKESQSKRREGAVDAQ